MPIKELREHLDHKYAEHDGWCGYCWLESEACAGEPGGGGYDYYVPLGELTQEQVYASHEAALAPRDMLRTDRRYLAMDDMTRHMYDLGRGTEHPADGTMSPAVGEHHHGLTRCTAIHGGGGEYAPEPMPWYDNPFALTGAIGGLTFQADEIRDMPMRDYMRWRTDMLISMSVNRPVNMIVITGF